METGTLRGAQGSQGLDGGRGIGGGGGIGMGMGVGMGIGGAHGLQRGLEDWNEFIPAGIEEEKLGKDGDGYELEGGSPDGGGKELG